MINSGHGAGQFVGPNGETVVLGAMVQNIYDPSYPQARSLMRYLAMGHNPYFAEPIGGDLVSSWLDLLRQFHTRGGTPVPTFTQTSRQATPASPYEMRAILALGTFDAHDGTGPMRSRVRLGALHGAGAGAWALTIERESVPAKLVAREWPTVVAMVRSWRQNGQEIERQTQVVIDDIHARARANQQLADARSAANDAHNASVEAGWDQSAKYNESFENYTLDRSVVEDSESGGHGTFDNTAADSMVRNQPNRYQYVPTQNYLKGIDY